MKKIVLSNGYDMPMLGLGTFPLLGEDLVACVKDALLVGYRSFDTAVAYGNEKDLGKAFKESERIGIHRKDIFITTKVSNACQRNGDIKKTCYNSLEKLGTDYIDLYLLHWPNPDTYVDAWKGMEELYKEGKVKAIGVSNFHEHHLNNLISNTSIIPMVNEIELHPLLNQEKIVDYCRGKDISIIAYSPLARMDKKLIEHTTLVELSKKYKSSVPQLIISWALHKGYATIPKAKNINKLTENYKACDLIISPVDISDIDNINENYRVRYNPDTCDFSQL